MTTQRRTTLISLMAVLALLSGASRGQTIPDLVKSQTLGVDESRFFYMGPTGMKGWMWWSSLTQDARQILVTDVRANTPASGVLQYHDVILGINGTLFTNDARVAFVDAVTAAETEAGAGQLFLTVYRPSIAATNAAVSTNTFMVALPVLGTLAEASPFGCPKTFTVLTNYCEFVYNNGPTGGSTKEPSVWAMMASGVPRYVNWATNYIRNASYASRTSLSVYRDTDQKVWYTGYQLITLCQYYLLTGDTNVMPAIADTANFIAQGQDLHGIWGHTMAWPSDNGGELHGTLPGYGALNNAGLAGLYGLALAQKCGVTDPEVDAAVDKAVDFFRAHMYIGAINYGYGPPASGVFDSNGRMGIAAHLFRALGDVEACKWFTMMTSAYGWRDWGHTGNEFNHCWGPTAADIGGPVLSQWLHDKDHWRVSLTMRRMPEGQFKSQGQEGRGEGRQSAGILSGGHATGGYGLQLAGPLDQIEITGQGYGSNYWLNADEFAAVKFAQSNENRTVWTSFTTQMLLDNLDCYAPKVAGRVADALEARLATEPWLVTNLISIVENATEKAHKRVAALNALGASNVWVRATTDTWYYPTAGYVLNWGAGYASRDTVSITNVLAAITQFDPEVGMDMLVAANYSKWIYGMATNLLDAAGMDLYYDAAAVILSPDCGGGWWVDRQGVKNWPPLIIARFADKIMRTAEQLAMGYDAPSVLKTQQIADGMHCAMVRASEYGGGMVDEGAVSDYGQHWGLYSNYTMATKSYGTSYHPNAPICKYQELKNILDITCQTPKPALNWFRNLIQTNIDNTLTNPAMRLADLRDNIAYNNDDDLFNAVCLYNMVNHPDNPDPFVDITNHVGFTAAVVGSHWRKYLGAVELGIADTNTVERWMDALAVADAAGNDRVVGGILHVLAGKGATNALSVAMSKLAYPNDYVGMAALDVVARVGTKNELLAVFNNFMTNSSMVVTSEDGESQSVGFKIDFWNFANWAAINGIVGRDYAGCLADVADQMAASFNTFTTNGDWVANIPHTSIIRTPPFSILNPVATQREVLGYGKGVFSALGLFARDNAACLTALSQVIANNSVERYYNRAQHFFASEAILRNYTVTEILGGGLGSWQTERQTAYYLMDRLLREEVPLGQQLQVLEFNNGIYQEEPDRYNIGFTYQIEMNYRRGLEEAEGTHFFYLK